MASFGPFIKDDGKRLRFRNKGIRMEGSSHLALRSPQVFDHFVQGFDAAGTGTTWKTTIAGQTTSTGLAGILAGVTGGVIRLTTAAGADSAASAVNVSNVQLCFRPDKLLANEKITFEARVRVPTGTTLNTWMGLHDLSGEATPAYVISASSTFTTSVPTDFAGFVYSSTPTSGVLNVNGTTTNYIGVINSCADTDVIASTGVLQDLLFHIYKVTVNAAGDVQYFIDDVPVYSQSYVVATTGLTPTAPLCASVGVGMVGQNAVGVDIDYLSICGAMDTTI